MSNKRIKILKTDNGGEYKSFKLQNHLLKKGTDHQFSAVYAHKQNSLIERPNRTILNKVRSILLEVKITKRTLGKGFKCNGVSI